MLILCKCLGLDFIRAEGFVFSHVADEGLMNACAGELLRYRKHIGAEHIQIFTDIKKKHRWILSSNIFIYSFSKTPHSHNVILMLIQNLCNSGMKVRLHNIFVIQDGQYVILVNHSAINSCCVSLRDWRSLQVHHSCLCVLGREAGQKTANQGTHFIKKKKNTNSGMLDFLFGNRWAYQDSTSLFFDYLTLWALYVLLMFIFMTLEIYRP